VPLLSRITDEDAHRRRWELLALSSVGAFMGPLDGSIVSVALPAMSPSLHLSFGAAMWVQAAYLLAMAVLLIPLGRLADQHGRVRYYLIGTAVFTVGSIAFQFAIGLGLALYFTRRFPLSGLLRAMLLLPWLLPLIVSSAIWRWMYDKDYGVVNALLKLIPGVDAGVPWLTQGNWALVAIIIANIWIGIPFNMVLLHGGLQSISEDIYEAAKLDGAGAWQRFRYMTWPLLKPVTLVVLMLGLVYTIKVFDVIMGLTGGGPANQTQTLTTWSYQYSFQLFKFGPGAAVSNLLIIIATVVGLLYLRSLRRSGDAR